MLSALLLSYWFTCIGEYDNIKFLLKHVTGAQMFPEVLTIKRIFLSALVALASFNAQAALTSYSPNGVDLVYSSVSDVTWTKDANLLGSMMESQGYDDVVNNILAVTPTISDPTNPWGTYNGVYNLSKDDFFFSSDYSYSGITNWYGAKAFVNYLNSINYGGSDKWILPTTSNTKGGWSIATNGATVGDELTELYYDELGRLPEHSTVPIDPVFVNEKAYGYWTGTTFEDQPAAAFVSSFDYVGYQVALGKIGAKFFVWATTSGEVLAIPEPESDVLLALGLIVLSIVGVRQNSTTKDLSELRS